LKHCFLSTVQIYGGIKAILLDVAQEIIDVDQLFIPFLFLNSTKGFSSKSGMKPACVAARCTIPG
jgi:hypothetical protein